jgi:predicted O-methyltransferase YrrM
VSDAFQDGVYQNPNTMTLAAAALSEEAISFMEDLIGRLTPSEDLEGQQAWYTLARAQFGKHLRFADLTTALWAASTLIRPSHYLEIGVRRGRSSCVVGATNPACQIVGFDLWLEDYAGVPNPGPDFVRSELDAVGHEGSVELISGDSGKTVPAYLDAHSDAFFDIITVDGDHTALGAATDIANVLPRLKVGGVLLFDDIVQTPALRDVWARLVKRDSRFVTWEYTDAGDGVAAAIRIGDEPW